MVVPSFDVTTFTFCAASGRRGVRAAFLPEGSDLSDTSNPHTQTVPFGNARDHGGSIYKTGEAGDISKVFCVPRPDDDRAGGSTIRPGCDTPYFSYEIFLFPCIFLLREF